MRRVILSDGWSRIEVRKRKKEKRKKKISRLRRLERWWKMR